MKKTVTLILLILVSLSFCNSQDFWQEVIIPDSINPGNVSFNSNSELYLTSSDGLYKSSDEGSTWSLLLSYTPGLSIINRYQDEIFVGIDNPGNIFHSLNDGLSWDTIYTGIQGGWLKLIQDSLLFCRDWGAIYKSVDYGNSWIKVFSTVNGEIFNDIIEENDTIFAGSTNFLDPTAGGIYQSLDLGASFAQISLPGYGVSSFALDQDSNLLCGVRFQYYGEEYGVFRSENNGYSWNNILPGYLVTSLVVDINGGIYAGCDSDFGPEGIQFSSDNGLTWSNLNNGLHANASITSLVISPEGFIYAVTEDPSKLYRSINPIVQILDADQVKNKLIIFPNPASSIVNIRICNSISINTFSNVHVDVISSCGVVCIIENLLSLNKNDLSLNLSGLSSGLYYILLHDNNHALFFTSVMKY